LQCALPVFENLLPDEHDAAWHSYAKLRLHTDDTLAFFDTATVVLGQSIQKFSKTICLYYHTTELPHEYAVCGRWAAALASQQTVKYGKKKAADLETTQAEPKLKKLNLETYKYHALGDYPNTIQCMGTSDNFSTDSSILFF